jgi:DNA primase
VGILDEDVTRVREATDIVELIGESVALKRVGRRYSGLCPFHAENTPSFSVNPEMGFYYCFGCNQTGDVITFVRETEHLDFVGTIERLANRAGITLRYDNANVGKERKRRARLVDATRAAIAFYHDRLLTAEDAKSARGYLRSRGFDGDAARRFQLGWAPDTFDALSRHLQDAKFSRDDITEAGLAFVNRANKLQDQFRRRLLFPIFDSRGDAVGFGGRALDGDGPKYKNTAETPLYHKSRVLYGLNWAKGEVVAKGEAVVCEGYTDVMACVLAGVPNAVATCGTALTDEHVEQLKNLARRVVLAYDADAAGQGAAERWYQWEQRYEIEVRVAAMPAGRDPAEVWQDDPGALLAAIEGAAPFLRFRLDRLLGQSDLESVEGRARAAEQAGAIVAEHPNEMVRDQYAVELAERLRLDAEGVRAAVRRGPRRDRPAPTAPVSRVATPKGDRRELDLLRWAIHSPELVADWLEESLFADPEARAAFDVLAASDTFGDAVATGDEGVRALLQRLAVEEPEDDPEPETLRSRLLLYAVEPAGARLLASMLRDGDPRVSEVKVQLDRLAHAREAGDWSSGEQAAKQLLTWIGADNEEHT